MNQQADQSDDAATRPGADGSEEALLVRLRAGDDDAFDELARSAAGRMLALARGMLPSEADAEEAVQDAFLSAFKALPRFDGRSRLTTWLHQITVNACLMKLRAKRRRPERSIESLLPQFVPDGHQSQPSNAWRALSEPDGLASELRAVVREKMDELPDQYRTVLILRDVQGLDTAEAAAVLDVSIDTVKTRLHRARQALKTLLDPYFAKPGT